MAFTAVIEHPRNIASWCRSCASLAAIAAHIQFSLAPSSLTIQAINSSRTTHAEVLFEKSFFREVTLDDPQSENHTFVVPSKHMTMLFKNLEPNALNYICLRVDTASGGPVQRQFKLNVEMSSKKLVMKKYQLGFQPVSGVTNNLHRYNELLQDTQYHQFVLETSVMKQFFEMVPIQTEDFGIEVKYNKINYTAYTKQIIKDRDYLKHPMSIMISMATDELPQTTLGEVETTLSFRLKDFRNFISLVSNLKAESSDLEPVEAESTFEAIFKESASPILFQHVRPNFSVRFLQITVDDGARSSEPSFVLDIPKLKAAALEKDPGTWKKLRISGPEPAASAQIDEEDTDYTNSEDEELGPTQNADRPKSLFD